MRIAHGMRAAVLSAAVALAVISPMAVPAAAAAPAPAAPVAGSDLGSATSTVVGTFTPSRFATSGDEITVDGLLAGQLVDSQGQSQAVSQEQTFAVQQIAPGVSCDILDLDLGPLDLDLLGLTVNLNEVLLNIAAVPGAGNLLGNLLCAVTGLLDGVGTIVQIVALLNQILALLGLLAG